MKFGGGTRVDRQDLAVEDGVSHPEPLTDCRGELVETLQGEPALRCKGGASRGDVQEAPIPVELGLEQPVRMIERFAPGSG